MRSSLVRRPAPCPGCNGKTTSSIHVVMPSILTLLRGHGERRAAEFLGWRKVTRTGAETSFWFAPVLLRPLSPVAWFETAGFALISYLPQSFHLVFGMLKLSTPEFFFRSDTNSGRQQICWNWTRNERWWRDDVS